MKQIIVFSFLYFVGQPIIVVAQQGNQYLMPVSVRSAYKQKNNSFLFAKSTPQNSSNYSWNKETQEWALTGNSKFSYADYNLLLTEELTLGLNNDSIDRTTLRYNEVGEEIYYFSEYWSENKRLPFYLTAAQFDQNGNKFLTFYKNWITPNEIVGGKDSVVFAGQGLQKQYFYFSWNSEQNGWQSNRKVDYRYNKHDQLVSETTYQYDQLTGLYTPSWLDTLLLDEAGMNTEEIILEWSGLGWQNVRRFTDLQWKEYNPQTGNGKLFTYIGQIWENSQWINKSKGEFVYGENESFIRTYQKYENEHWINESQITHYNDEEGNDRSDTYEEWQDSLWKITAKDSTILLYNPEQQLVTMIKQTWDNQSSSLVNLFKWEYNDFISASMEQNLPKAAFLVYPNPAKDVAYIQGDMQDETTVIVYDLSGRVVKEQAITISHKKIELSDLVPGLYLLNLKNATGVQVQKMIKN